MDNPYFFTDLKRHICKYIWRETGIYKDASEYEDHRDLLDFACDALNLGLDKQSYPSNKMAKYALRCIATYGRDVKKIQDMVHARFVDAMQSRQQKIIETGRKPRLASTPEHAVSIGGLPSKLFYKSPEWRALRYDILSKNGNVCECCGSSPKNGACIHIDHIKPRSIYPELALDPDNMQVLCEDCNMGKSNKYEDDWRN